MNETKDVVNFEDAETSNNFVSQDKQTFRSIILSHLNNIMKFASVEFRGGFYEERPLSMQGGIIRTYIPDSRAVYYNAVDCLADALHPYFDKKMKEAEEECIKEENKAYDICSKTIELKVGEDIYEGKRLFSAMKEQYRDERVNISRKLFRALCDFLHRKKYLEVGTLED